MNETERTRFVQKIKARRGPEKKTRKTFTLDSQLYVRFGKECKKREVSKSEMLEQFMRDFVGDEN